MTTYNLMLKVNQFLKGVLDGTDPAAFCPCGNSAVAELFSSDEKLEVDVEATTKMIRFLAGLLPENTPLVDLVYQHADTTEPLYADELALGRKDMEWGA